MTSATIPAGDAAATHYRVPGKILVSRLRTFLAFPEWFYLPLPVNTMTAPQPTPGGRLAGAEVDERIAGRRPGSRSLVSPADGA